MVKAKLKLYEQHYEWLSDDIRAEIDWILQTGESDEKLIDCLYDLGFIYGFYKEGYMCDSDTQYEKLRKAIEEIVRKYDNTSDIRPRTVSSENENETICLIYE